MLKSYFHKGCIMGAGSKGKDETLTEGRGSGGGIVPGHACKYNGPRSPVCPYLASHAASYLAQLAVGYKFLSHDDDVTDSIINVYESFGFKLVKLRNPWGTFEWQGNWSWKSDLWHKHSTVKV